MKDDALFKAPEQALHRAVTTTNAQLHSSAIDDSLSGTTAVGVLLRGSTIQVANVGDSRAIVAEQQGDKLVAADLTSDQTPFRSGALLRLGDTGACLCFVSRTAAEASIHKLIPFHQRILPGAWCAARPPWANHASLRRIMCNV